MLLVALCSACVAPAALAGPAEEARRTQALALLAALAECGAPPDRVTAWLALAASPSQDDEHLVRRALADPALLLEFPAEIRQREAALVVATIAATEVTDGTQAPAVGASASAKSPGEVIHRRVGGLAVASSRQLVDTTLENGLRVVVLGEPALGVSAVVHQVRAGGAHDPPGAAGLAHLVEHLMFEGVSGDATWWDAAEGLGISVNASTSHDRTRYTSIVAPDLLLDALQLESSRFLADLDTNALPRELGVVADEERLRNELDPSDRAVDALSRGLLAGHPYGNPLGGSGPSGRPLDHESATQFFGAYYGAANTELIVTGPHDPEAVLSEIRKLYAGMRAGVRSAPVRALAGVPDRPVRVRAAGLPARLSGKAWLLPDIAECSGDEQGDCARRFWTRRLMLRLLQDGGEWALSVALTDETLLRTPVTILEWDGRRGGLLLVVARRRPELPLLLNGVASLGMAVLVGIANVVVVPYGEVLENPVPPQRNPTPGLIDLVIANDRGRWASEEQLERTREQLVTEEALRTWSALDSAEAIADRIEWGLPLDAEAIALVDDVTPEAINEEFIRLFVKAHGVAIHVR